MDNYPGNSQKPRASEEEKRVERVVSGEVTRRKRPAGKRLLESIIGGDARSVLGYVISDVLLPAAKDAITEAVSQGIERMLFGESRSGNRRSGARSSGGYVSYNRYSQPARREEPREISRRARASHSFDEIILATRAEAEEVIDRLFDLVSRYESASVSDLFEMVGVTGNYTDQDWGWTDLRGASIQKVRGGYLLDLPRTEQLK